ncbi:class II fructose-bisphosphate aldolase [Deinococcus marmoris]|uniref:Fructose-bisphosphate aldolase class II n=1 Tax=Deinococcus marmoris TaxID=249408 RepID=A0A1U7NTI2_9DEIO|nr:class II fructose-bisphosphate aldolase [Deinococcus marmoris]OLV16215.1 Fructose-bisphosphate aldolase class II [Deinococcus marmoris]
MTVAAPQTSADIIRAARAGGYALAAFNAVNLETAQAIVRAAEAVRAPVILQFSQNAARHGGLAQLAALGQSLKSDEDVPTFVEAVGRWPGGAFDLLVVDLNLPDGLGMDLLARALELAAGVPVVVMSGHENPRLAAQAVQLGARGYVIKDLEAAEHLHDIVAQLT